MQSRSKYLWGIIWLCLLFVCTTANAATLSKGPYLIYPNVTTEMQVLWQTNDTPAGSTVEWGQTTEYGFTSGFLAESGSGADEHQFTFTMTGLETATRYFYRVTVDSAEVTGSFVTAPPDSANTVTIYGYGDTRTYPEDHDSVVARLMEDVDMDALKRQTVILHSADWVGSGDTEGDWTDEYFNRSYPNSLEFMSRMPVMGSRGNHEQSGVLLRKYWPYDYQDDVGCYYSFDYGPVHVTVIDQYVDFSPGSVQYTWLENDLAGTQKPWKFIVLHEPAWSAGGGHDNDAATQQDLVPLFERYGVAVVHAGHNHYYARCAVNAIQHITAGGGGAPIRTPELDYPNVVTAEDSLHFVRYDISGSRMTVTVIRDDGTLIETFIVDQSNETSVVPWVHILLIE